MCTAALGRSASRSALTSLIQLHPKRIPRRTWCKTLNDGGFVIVTKLTLQTTGLVWPFVLLELVGNSNRLSNANGTTDTYKRIQTRAHYLFRLYFAMIRELADFYCARNCIFHVQNVQS